MEKVIPVLRYGPNKNVEGGKGLKGASTHIGQLETLKMTKKGKTQGGVRETHSLWRRSSNFWLGGKEDRGGRLRKKISLQKGRTFPRHKKWTT